MTIPMPKFAKLLQCCLALGASFILVTKCFAQDTEPEEKAPANETTESVEARLDGRTAAERGTALMRYVASLRPKAGDELTPKASAPCYAAKLMLNTDAAYALEMLDKSAGYQIAKCKSRHAEQQKYNAAADKSQLKKPGAALDPFDKVGLVNAYFLCKDKIPKPTALKIRDYVALWGDHKQLTGYARGAWNYKLMMDGAGYLAAEEWPELVDREGLNASQIKEATKQRLLSGFQEITTKNFTEYGATIYLAVNLSAIRMVAEFARDAELRKKAALTLDVIMLDIACTWNQGYNTGSASRAKYWASTDTGPDSMASTAAAAWVFFGGKRPISGRGTGWIHSFWMATLGSYKVPEIIVNIAQDRSKPFVTRSTVPAMGDKEVCRITYHTPSYSVCSQWDRGMSPTDGMYKEARRNMLKWLSDKRSSTFAVCMENPARPYALAENRANALGYGENAFSQYMQDEGTLLGLYDVPDKVQVRNHVFDYPYRKLYAPFPTSGSIVKRMEKDGWVFCHAGSMFFAFHSVKPYTWGNKPWSGNDMLWVDARRNGWILETSELNPFAGGGVDAELNRFASAVLSKTKVDASGLEATPPRLSYKNLAGRTMEFEWRPHGQPSAGQTKIDGKAIDYKSWPLFDNPWVHQDVNSPILTLKHDNHIVTYDFNKWTRTEQTVR